MPLLHEYTFHLVFKERRTTCVLRTLLLLWGSFFSVCRVSTFDCQAAFAFILLWQYHYLLFFFQTCWHWTGQHTLCVQRCVFEINRLQKTNGRKFVAASFSWPFCLWQVSSEFSNSPIFFLEEQDIVSWWPWQCFSVSTELLGLFCTLETTRSVK